MKPIGIVSALAAEAAALGPAAAHGAELRRLGDGALLAVSGIGESAAAAAARRLVLAGVGGLVSFGMAGGLDPALLCGAVLLPEEIVAGDGTLLAATAGEWRQRLRAALPAACIACGGKLLTSERPLGDPAAKAAAWRASRALAVDMESAAIARVAQQTALPFIALRVIVDAASDRLPATVIGASGGGQLRIGRLLAGLLRAPRDVGGLIRLAARYRIARRVLTTLAAPGSAARRALAGGPQAGSP